MSHRTRRTELTGALARLNETRTANGLAPLDLSIWSPGDGWTRYQLTDTCAGAPWARTRSRVCTASEMLTVLYALIEMSWELHRVRA